MPGSSSILKKKIWRLRGAEQRLPGLLAQREQALLVLHAPGPRNAGKGTGADSRATPASVSSSGALSVGATSATGGCSSGVARPLPRRISKCVPVCAPAIVSHSPSGQRTRRERSASFGPSPKWTQVVDCARKPSPQLTDRLRTEPSPSVS